MKVVRQQDIQLDEWQSFLSECPAASLYHLPEWSHILERTFGYRPFNLFALDDEGKLCGFLPLSLVKNPFGGSHLVSLPFSHVVGPLYSSDAALEMLISEAKDISHSLKNDTLEIRATNTETPDCKTTIWAQKGFETSLQFSTYLLKLSKAEDVWNGLDSTRRWAVRKAQKNGVTFRTTESKEDIKTFFRINCANKKTLGIPGHPEAFFLNLFDELRGRCHLYLAEYQQRIVAGIVTLEFGDYVFYGYAASLDAYKTYQPNVFLIWKAIEDSCNKGFKFFDFGRVSSTERNLAVFKLNWGTAETALAYHYYPNIPASMTLNRKGLRYRLTTNVWRRMPAPLARAGSNMVFKYLG